MEKPDFKPKERFSNRVDEYAKYRPSYPQDLVDSLVQKLPTSSRVTPSLADVGSGTGIFSRLLLESGFTIYAIEPNGPMRARAEEMLTSFPGFQSVDGDATHTTLGNHSVDAVVVAQAFHWFATQEAVAEFTRILKKPGIVMLAWNDRLTDCDDFHAGYESLLVRYCLNYLDVNHRNITSSKIESLFPGWTLTIKHFANDQPLDFTGLKGRLESSSYCPPKDHPNYLPLMDGVEELFKRYAVAGEIRLRQDCVAYFLVRQELL
jgi:SAM-dependent methyltransferase